MVASAELAFAETPTMLTLGSVGFTVNDFAGVPNDKPPPPYSFSAKAQTE